MAYELDTKAQDYIKRVAEFAISNLKRKGVTKEQFEKIVAREDFIEKAIKAYNDHFDKWSKDPETHKTVARMVHEAANK